MMMRPFRRRRRARRLESADVPRRGQGVVLTVKIHREGPHFVGEALGLGVSSFGDTLEEAVEMTMDAVCTQLVVINREGSALDYLRDRGLRIVDFGDFARPEPVETEVGEFVTRQAMPVASEGLILTG